MCLLNLQLHPSIFIHTNNQKPLHNHLLLGVDFYIHGSVHHNSISIRSNKMQQYASIYLLQNYSTYFGHHHTQHQEYIKP